MSHHINLLLSFAAIVLTACGSTSTPAGPGVAADYFKQNAADEQKLAQGCRDLFGNPKDVAALHGVITPGLYEWESFRLDPADEDIFLNCDLTGPDIRINYKFLQGSQWTAKYEVFGPLTSDIKDDHFTSMVYSRFTLSTEQERKVKDLLNAANASVK